MADIIRDSSLGQLIRYATSNRYLQYAEERPGFVLPTPVAPEFQEKHEQLEKDAATEPSTDSDSPSSSSSSSEINIDLERAVSQGLRPTFSRTTQQEAVGPQRTVSRPIQPTITSDGTILVDWYSTDDADNPLNWSLRKRTFISIQILLYTFTVYMGSSIYAPSIYGVMEEFGVGETAASLGLALYVLGYGIGPMLFSPLSEMPLIGRNPPYVATFAIFVILTIPGALTNTFAGLLIVRFLLGFFGSPSLATGPASLQDMFRLIKVPYLLSFWAGAATLGPALGPVVGAYTVQAKNWRWPQLEMLFLSAPIFLIMFVSLPETSAANILLRRARRLRKLLDNENLKSQSEIDQANMSLGTVTYDALLIPWKINFLDPAVAFSTFYTALVYAIYYSFCMFSSKLPLPLPSHTVQPLTERTQIVESFPLVYPIMYDFTPAQSSLPFLSILVSLAIFLPIYNIYFRYAVEIPFPTHGFGAPERRLIPGLYGTFLIPIGLYIFAFTSRPAIHWIVPTFGAGLSVGGVYVVLQSIFLYLPFTYAQYSASLFAANDFARSTLAAAAILFSRPLFLGLGVQGGMALLASLTVLCTFGIFVLFFFGEGMRRRSRFAAK